MLKLLVLKKYIKEIYSKHEQYITPALKFLLALFFLMVISFNAGFNTTVKNPIVIIIIALICAFLPLNIDILIMMLVILVHLFAFSPEIAMISFLIMLIMYLLYFRFTLKDSLVVLLMPILFFIKIPYVIPLVLGLTASPLSIISVTFGSIIYFILDFVGNNSVLINNMSTGSGVTKMTMILTGIINNKMFLLTFISFGLMIIIVYVVRKWSIDHAHLIAVIVGGAVNVVIMLLGYLIFNLAGLSSIIFVVFGSIVSIALAYILQFVILSVDYTRTEYTQFEDDEYYYYVKAVPKISMTTPEISVKRINVQRTKKKR